MDVRKMQLVTQDSIREAYAVLKDLEERLQPGPNQSEQEHEENLRRLSDSFYNLIPHRGNKPVIKTTEMIKEKK